MNLANFCPISFVGLSGGEIFHEMMLRLGVENVCESYTPETVHRNRTAANNGT
jgi:hypothetical protein